MPQWMLPWRGTGVNFEIIPVVADREVSALITPLLDEDSRVGSEE